MTFSSIGAGGSSIAWIDAAGVLKVGPQSAGSEPGPVCYGRGGTQPTITDAYVTLGILDPGKFLGGELPLNAKLSHKAIDALGAKLRLGLRMHRVSRRRAAIDSCDFFGTGRRPSCAKASILWALNGSVA